MAESVGRWITEQGFERGRGGDSGGQYIRAGGRGV